MFRVNWTNKQLNDVLSFRIDQDELANLNEGKDQELTPQAELQRRFDRHAVNTVPEDWMRDLRGLSEMPSHLVCIRALTNLMLAGYPGYMPSEQEKASIYRTVKSIEQYADGKIRVDEIPDPEAHLLPFATFGKWYLLNQKGTT